MSPEQMHSKDVGPETDIWALGVILYELLTAQLPFDGDTVAEVVLKVTSELPRPARKVRPELPEALDVAMLRCLERDGRSRFGDVAQLAKAIAPFGPTGAKASVDRIAGIIESAGRRQAAPSRLRALRAELQQTQTASIAVARHIATLVKSRAGLRAVAAGMAFVVTMAMIVFGIRLRSRHIADARNTVHATSLDAPAAVASQPASEPPAATVLPTPTDFPRVPPNAPVRTGSNSIAHPSASQRNRSGPAKANCRVVSFFDRDGDQHFRQECGN
jgi:serine/threonine protein kinase